jgi:formate dehydrogenase subunit gamma
VQETHVNAPQSPQTQARVARIWEIAESHRHMPGALLPILHALQDAFRYVPDEAVPIIADTLNLSRAEVHGVISFYHHFRRQPPGRHVIQICRAEACQAMGATQLEAHVKERLGCDYHETSIDHDVTLEPVYCLGNCACGPSMTIDDNIIGRVDCETFDTCLAELRAHNVEAV